MNLEILQPYLTFGRIPYSRRTEEKFVLICLYNGFNQLNEKYGDNTAQIILDNAYVWNYLKTSSDTTAEKISKKIR